MVREHDYLRLEFSHDGDPFDPIGRLAVHVRAHGFSGSGSVWVQWQDLLNLSEKLSDFPLSAENPVIEDWGYGEAHSYRSVVRLEFGPFDSAGPVLVKVYIANDDDDGFAVRCKFKIGYQALGTFSKDIAVVAKRKSGHCTLSEPV